MLIAPLCELPTVTVNVVGTGRTEMNTVSGGTSVSSCATTPVVPTPTPNASPSPSSGIDTTLESSEVQPTGAGVGMSLESTVVANTKTESPAKIVVSDVVIATLAASAPGPT